MFEVLLAVVFEVLLAVTLELTLALISTNLVALTLAVMF
jgi:hypothetical protein